MEKKTLFWKVIISAIVRKKFHINMRLMKSEVHKRKVDTQDESLARVLVAAARTKKREDHLSRTSRDLRTRVAKCSETGNGTVDRLF